MQYMILLPLVCAIALPIIAKFKKVSTKAGAKPLLATNIVTFFVCVAVTVVTVSYTHLRPPSGWRKDPPQSGRCRSSRRRLRRRRASRF